MYPNLTYPNLILTSLRYINNIQDFSNDSERVLKYNLWLRLHVERMVTLTDCLIEGLALSLLMHSKRKFIIPFIIRKKYHVG